MLNRSRRMNHPVKRGICTALGTLMLLNLSACGSNTGGTVTTDDVTEPSGEETEEETKGSDSVTEFGERETFVSGDFQADACYYEAEDATLNGAAYIDSSRSGYSGTGYVEGFFNDGDGVTFNISVEQSGFYDLNFRTGSLDTKTNYVYVDGEKVGELTVGKTNGFENSIYNHIYLAAGDHTVSYMKYWGYVAVDTLAVTASQTQDYPDSFYEVDSELSNPNATTEAKKVYAYMCEVYGHAFLSGQYCDGGMYGAEMQAIRNATGGITDGKYPAVLGLDLMEYTPSRVENGTNGVSVEYAKQWWEEGGIVTFCWHWNAPSKYITGNWYSAFYTDSTNIDLAKIMSGEDEEGYDLLMADIDAIAAELKELQDAGVPVLWRPLHEASGGWFWWGAGGAEAYKELYILLYDKLTNEYGLNNLIWVWNGQDADWYPWDEYVDIVGTDIYPGEHVYTSQIGSFLETRESAGGNKMVILSENGCLFDPETAYRDGAMWGLWCTWGGELVITSSSIAVLSETYTEKEQLIKTYESPYTITLDELPDWDTYME